LARYRIVKSRTKVIGGGVNFFLFAYCSPGSTFSIFLDMGSKAPRRSGCGFHSHHETFAGLPQGFRLWFISAYLFIAGGVTITVNSLYSGEPHILRNNLLIFFMILALSVYEVRRELIWKNRFRMFLRILGFLGQILIVEGIHAVQHSRDSWILYPYLVFSAYFQFGRKVSYPLVGLFVVMNVVQIHFQNQFWTSQPSTVLFVISRIIITVFFQILALMFHREEGEKKKSDSLFRELTESNRQLQQYSVQAVNLAAMEERNRIAREIHDSVGHFLTVTNIQLEKAMAYQDRDPQQARQAMIDAKWAAAEALKDVRESIHALRDKTDEFLFEQAVRRLVDPVRDISTKVTLDFQGDYRNYNRTILMALYRVIQEGITNIQKHARAGQIEIFCSFGDNTVELIVRDDGRGFDPDGIAGHQGARGGYGLAGLTERLELVRGRIEIRSAPGEGTEIRVRIPRELGMNIPREEG